MASAVIEPDRWYRGADVPPAAIRQLAGEIAQKFQPERIILFGSHAYGTPHEDSDVDMLVIMPARNELDQAVKISLAIDAPFSLDLIVRTPTDLERRLREGDHFLREIIARGKVLYGRDKKSIFIGETAPTHIRKLRLNGDVVEVSSMKKLTGEWVEKAETDFRVARVLYRSRDSFSEPICFHCQQAAEKYLKALMQELGITVPRTHELQDLLKELVPHYKSLRRLRPGAKFLSQFAVGPRYPGKTAKRRQAEAALRWCRKIRPAVRKLLGIY
jgi:HEPN domain-containing protein/predicted nucleotidyltransferase